MKKLFAFLLIASICFSGCAKKKTEDTIETTKEQIIETSVNVIQKPKTDKHNTFDQVGINEIGDLWYIDNARSEFFVNDKSIQTIIFHSNDNKGILRSPDYEIFDITFSLLDDNKLEIDFLNGKDKEVYTYSYAENEYLRCSANNHNTFDLLSNYDTLNISESDIDLSMYIENMIDVEYAIMACFSGHGEIIIEERPEENDISTLKQFGNGNYVLYANGIKVIVECLNYKAKCIRHADGSNGDEANRVYYIENSEELVTIKTLILTNVEKDYTLYLNDFNDDTSTIVLKYE